MLYTIALFGEAEKGAYHTPYICEDLIHLDEYLGNPPRDTCGLYYAVQLVLLHHRLIFFRVHEEGFSLPDYYSGLELLKRKDLIITRDLSAIALPGVGNEEVYEAANDVCHLYHSILISNEADLYDYLTR